MEDVGQQLIPGEVENLSLVNVENPACRGDGEDKPLVGRHTRVPRGRGGIQARRLGRWQSRRSLFVHVERRVWLDSIPSQTKTQAVNLRLPGNHGTMGS